MAPKNPDFLKYICLAWLLLFSWQLQAQDSRYMVFFSGKDTVTYRYDQPEDYLSERAIARRQKFDIPLQFTDLPVDSAYLKGIAQAGGKVFYTSRWFNAALVACHEAALAQIKSLDFVIDTELVKPVAGNGRKKEGNAFGKASQEPLAQEEALLNMLQNEMLGIDQMHALGYNGKGLLIGVFDGGFRGVDTAPFFQHLFENGQIVPGYDFVGNSTNVFRYGQHGTEALSCIAGYAPGVLEAGAYAADVMLCVTEEGSSEYRIEEYNWLFAAERADSAGVDIISTSLGYTTFDDAAMNYTFTDLDGKTAAITRAVSIATDKGILCVVSAGNEGTGSWRYVSPPADAPDILAVGAVGAQRNRVSFSSFGPTSDGRIKPDVSALGLQTVVVDAQGNVTTSNGTSFSAPLIAGFVAGVWQAHPELSNKEIVEKVKAAGNQALTPDNELGFGIPDFSRVLEETLTPVATRQPASYFTVFPNPVEEGKVFIESKSGTYTGALDIVVYSSTGQVVLQKHLPNYNKEAIGIDTETLAQGIYILQVLARDSSDTFKLVKF